MSAVLFGVNVPVPPDQIPVVVGPDITPERTVAMLFLQVVILIPAFTLGELVKTTIKLSFAGLQFPLLVELRNNFTCPAETSEALGK